VRLQKFLASCGLGSRRACEQLIAAGAVSIDGLTVSEPGHVVDPARNVVRVNGQVVAPQSLAYVIINKPTGYVCSSNDPEGRKTFLDLLPPDLPRVFSVGRLDRDSEGLLLVTNDGDWANRIQHPRHHVVKTYHVWTDRSLAPAERHRLIVGITDEGELLRVLAIRPLPHRTRGAAYAIELGEGRNRHIRRLLAGLDVRVTRLRRTRIGPLTLKGLQVGEWRQLTAAEVRAIDPAQE
jgi:23S rRNA pseudouridine2605 synthase